MCTISVIIPVYNVEAFINKCLDSILNQNNDDFEVILIDDGSPDKSGLICDEYAAKDSRINVIHKTNAGVGEARNTGIENANGDWIMFVDSDDYIDQGMIQCGIDSIRENPKSDAVIFYNRKDNAETGSEEFIDRVFSCSKTVSSKEFFVATEYFEKASCIYSKLYRKNIIEKQNIRFASTPVYEDVLFNMNYFMYVDKIFFVDRYFYHYMIYPSIQSLTRSVKKPNDILKTTKAYLTIEPNLFGNIVFSEKEKSIIRNRFFQVATWGVSNMYRIKMPKEERFNLLKEFLPLYRKFKIKGNLSMSFRKFLLTNNFMPVNFKDLLLSKVI